MCVYSFCSIIAAWENDSCLDDCEGEDAEHVYEYINALYVSNQGGSFDWVYRNELPKTLIIDSENERQLAASISPPHRSYVFKH